MPIARTRLAAGHARRLLTRLQITSPPVDVRSIALRHDIKVNEEDFPDTLSGALLRSDAGVVIAINKRHGRNRQRFTVAHELGHFFLHRDAAGYYDQGHLIGVHFRATPDGSNWDAKEIEANQFAANLLMPASMVENASAELGQPLYDHDVSELANRFEVSEQAMTIRLQALGLL